MDLPGSSNSIHFRPKTPSTYDPSFRHPQRRTPPRFPPMAVSLPIHVILQGTSTNANAQCAPLHSLHSIHPREAHRTSLHAAVVPGRSVPGLAPRAPTGPRRPSRGAPRRPAGTRPGRWREEREREGERAGEVARWVGFSWRFV